jgi:hypothetical protein
MRVKEHHQYICVYHLENYAVAEPSKKLGHCIKLHNTSILAKKLRNERYELNHQGSKRD